MKGNVLGQGGLKPEDQAKLIPSNIRKDIEIDGVVGTLKAGVNGIFYDKGVVNTANFVRGYINDCGSPALNYCTFYSDRFVVNVRLNGAVVGAVSDLIDLTNIDYLVIDAQLYSATSYTFIVGLHQTSNQPTANISLLNLSTTASRTGYILDVKSRTGTHRIGIQMKGWLDGGSDRGATVYGVYGIPKIV